jgi:hypothetical protein
MFDTPGTGPSNDQALPARQPDDELYRFFKDEWDSNVLIDLDSDNGRPEGPTLADQAPWLEGLMAAGILSQELEAQIAETGSKLFHADFMVHTAQPSMYFRPDTHGR